jgi:hypothetical protein
MRINETGCPLIDTQWVRLRLNKLLSAMTKAVGNSV